MQYGNSEGFYQQGIYSSEQDSYIHHQSYFYRSNDVEVRQGSGTNKYLHLLLDRTSPCRRGTAPTTTSTTVASACQSLSSPTPRTSCSTVATPARQIVILGDGLVALLR